MLRLALLAGGLGMLIPGTITDVLGFVVVGGVILYQRTMAKRQNAAA